MLAMLAAVCGCMVQGCCLHTGFLALTSKFSVAGKRGWYGAAAEKTALYQGANRFDGAFDLHVALFAKPHLVTGCNSLYGRRCTEQRCIDLSIADSRAPIPR